MPVCAKIISSWVRKVVSTDEAQMSLCNGQGDVASGALAADVSLVSILQAGYRARVSTPARHYFSTNIIATDEHQDSVQCAVLGPSE